LFPRFSKVLIFEMFSDVYSNYKSSFHKTLQDFTRLTRPPSITVSLRETMVNMVNMVNMGLSTLSTVSTLLVAALGCSVERRTLREIHGRDCSALNHFDPL